MFSKILTIFKIVVGVIGAIFFIRILMADGNALEVDSELQNSLLSPFIIFSYIMMGLIVAITIAFSIIGLAKGNLKKTLIALGSFIVVVAVSYFTATGNEVQTDDGVVTANASQWISAGLNMFYILLITSLSAILASSVIKIITSR